MTLLELERKKRKVKDHVGNATFELFNALCELEELEELEDHNVDYSDYLNNIKKHLNIMERRIEILREKFGIEEK